MTFPQIVKIHDLFMTIQVSDSDSGLFRFVHDCGHPAKRSLRNFKGEQVGGSGDIAGAGQTVKLEPAFLAENEEALAAAGYYRSRRETTAVGSGFSMGRGNRGRGGGRGSIARSGTESNRRSYAR